MYRKPITVVKSVSAKKKTTSSSKKTSNSVNPAKFTVFKPLIISELLPNPASPIKDADGEFVELYNPNESAVELEGLIVQTGSNFNYSHTFEKGTSIGPGVYIAIFYKDTKLTLSNSGGAARLLLPNGEPWGDAVTYEDSEEGESYALINGVWQCTKEQTPGAENKAFIDPDPATEEATAGTSGFGDIYKEPPVLAGTTQSWLMVGGMGLATLLYSGYEYRKDFANKLWQYRRNKSTG